MTLSRWLPKDGKDARTWLLFIGGLAGVGYETLGGGDRPYLLVIFGAMMGLPLFLRQDESPHQSQSLGRLPQLRQLPPSPPPPGQEQSERES